MIFLCGVMIVAGTACKNANTPEDKTVQKRHLTIKMSDSAAGAPVRHIKNATITDEGSTLLAEWTAGDAVSYCNLSRPDGTPLYIGTMTAATSGVKSDLTGDVNCTENDYIAVVYPAADLSSLSYEMGDNIHCKFSISLAGQDGTLSTLASTYHYVYGRAHVISTSGDNAVAEMDKMQSLLTVCKFSFVDKTNPGVALPINTLTISYGGSDSKTDKYPQSATVTVTNLTENNAASAVADEPTTPLTITCPSAQNEVYVALLPESDKVEYKFTVTSGSDTYTGKAEAHLKKGEYVPATGLKLVAN